MEKRGLISPALREKLEAQLKQLLRQDEEEFALRLASSASLLPEEACDPHFAYHVRQLWTDGAQDASMQEWEKALPARWKELMRKAGSWHKDLTVEGEFTEPMLSGLAELLVGAYEKEKFLSSWKGI